jgi:hypothetical protein
MGIAIRWTATQPFQGCVFKTFGCVFPRVARTQPWAEISERFQRLVAKSGPSSLRLLNASRYSRHQEYELVIDDSIPKEGSLFEFGVLSPGLSRDERDLIVHQHDGSKWQ